jgi:hypothetical protein
VYPHVEQFETKALRFAGRAAPYASAGDAARGGRRKRAARRPAGRNRALYATSLRLIESASARSFFRL